MNNDIPLIAGKDITRRNGCQTTTLAQFRSKSSLFL